MTQELKDKFRGLGKRAAEEGMPRIPYQDGETRKALHSMEGVGSAVEPLEEWYKGYNSVILKRFQNSER